MTGPITTSFGGGRQESDSKTGTQDGGRGARGTILNKGWSCDDTSSAARCATWLGGTRRVEGGEQRRPVSRPCPVFQERKAQFYQGRSQGDTSAWRGSGQLITKNVERVVTTTPNLSHQLVPPVLRWAGAHVTFPPSFPSTGKALPLASDLVVLTAPLV